ncbi:MAG: hypothetical protein WC554_06100 [Clostridia bacterium]|jgi:hypothetical protein
MRLLVFQDLDDMDEIRHREKLTSLSFTTFRLPRLDKDWYVGEILEVVLQPIGKKKFPLGQAEVIFLEPKDHFQYGDKGISDEEALKDGFRDSWELRKKIFWTRRHGKKPQVAYKLTLEWKVWYSLMIQKVTGDKPLEQRIIDRIAEAK